MIKHDCLETPDPGRKTSLWNSYVPTINWFQKPGNSSLDMIFWRPLLSPSEVDTAFEKCSHRSICTQNMRHLRKLAPHSIQCLGPQLLYFLLRDRSGMILGPNPKEYKTSIKFIFIVFSANLFSYFLEHKLQSCTQKEVNGCRMFISECASNFFGLSEHWAAAIDDFLVSTSVPFCPLRVPYPLILRGWIFF